MHKIRSGQDNQSERTHSSASGGVHMVKPNELGGQMADIYVYMLYSAFKHYRL